MSIVITSSANRFSMNGVIFKDFINLDRVLSVSLCKDRYYSRFDMLFYFKLGTRNASYTDETLLRVGPFSNNVLEKAEDLIMRFFNEKEKVFNIEQELLGKAENIQAMQAEVKGEEQEFANQAKTIAVQAAKKMKAEGLPIEVICKVLGLSEIEFNK
ncbi:hypothetical protein R83H12_02284 [Fibrobacteria bacterium R8-3-H12]